MAIITKVRFEKFNDGMEHYIVWYKNKKTYGEDRMRMFSNLPRSAEAFIKIAKNVETREYTWFTITDYTN